MKENCKRILLLVILFGLLFYTFFHTLEVVDAFLSYSQLFLLKVFPTSFLFLTFSSLLMEVKFFSFVPIKHSSVYFLLHSLLSGFPAGCICVREALEKNTISKEEANQMILFTHFPNPLFVLYTVSTLFPNTKIFFVFYGILILSNTWMIFFVKSKRILREGLSSVDLSSSLNRSIHKSMETILLIYGVSILFYLISFVLTNLFSFHSFFYVFLMGFFDLTNGVFSTSIISSIFLRGIYLFFFLSFGSLSIHLQIKSILSDTSISYVSFVKGRILSFLTCCILWIIYGCCTIFIG